MSLKDADIRPSYFLDGTSPYFFYNELYLHATEITIALGYFAKTAFCIGTEALLYFIKNNNGKIHLICNDKMLFDDTEAISYGYYLKERDEIYLSDFEELISNKNESGNDVFSYKCLAYLIALDRVDIKVAKSSRLVHFKTGFATDNEGNIVAFSGSVNYTLSALYFNWEQLITYRSWVNPEADMARIEDIRQPILELFSDSYVDLPLVQGADIEEFIKSKYKTDNFEELEQEAELSRKHIKVNLTEKKIAVLENGQTEGFLKIPATYNPYSHQEKAIKNFRENSYKTLFAMATGTGKTLTSLFAVNDLDFEHPIQSLLILVPLQDLVPQWEKDVKRMYKDTIIKISSKYQGWREQLSHLRIKRKLHSEGYPVVIISTYESYLLNYNDILSVLNPDDSVIIADECHAFGAERKQAVMPEQIQYRIGLSATPKRSHDTKGTKAIFDYFCPSENPYEFSLGEAIKAGFLCKYNYYPIFVRMTEDEYSQYQIYTEKISRLLSINKNLDDSDDEALTLLLKQRHRLIENAENKIEAVTDYFLHNLDSKDFSKTIVFCPEGNGSEDGSASIDAVQKAIWSACKAKHKRLMMTKYIQGSELEILKKFEKGSIDLILAKKRLNEGIDIPAIKRALFISSSTSEREFIQRRGRVLRKHPSKKIAEIIDFIVIPPDTINNVSIVFANELQRCFDFLETAENYGDALIEINKNIG